MEQNPFELEISAQRRLWRHVLTPLAEAITAVPLAVQGIMKSNMA
jgi:hypothetical protein